MKTKKEDCKCSGNSVVRSEGEYTVIVRRNSFNILFDLPYCLWGSIYLSGGNFATAVKDYLPAGVVATSQVVGVSVVFTYTSGALVDTIVLLTVPTEMISYPEFLSNLKTNYLKSELIYFCNNAMATGMPVLTSAQNDLAKSKPLYLQKVGGLGSKTIETIVPLTRKIPNNSVENVTEIYLRKQSVKPETSWIHQFPYIQFTQAGQKLSFYWQLIINDIVNVNDENMSLAEMRERSQ